MLSSRPWLLASVVAAALVLVACGSREAPSAQPLDRLCEAAEATDPEEARELFAGQTHVALHELADDLTAADLRPVAGDVLEGMNGVEDAFSQDPIPDDLADRFDFLLDAIGRALDVLDRPALACTD